MKSKLYNALATLNQGFDVAMESLMALKAGGVLAGEYVQQQTEIAEELRAGINHMILDKLERREAEDWAHYGQMRLASEMQLKSSHEQRDSNVRDRATTASSPATHA